MSVGALPIKPVCLGELPPERLRRPVTRRRPVGCLQLGLRHVRLGEQCEPWPAIEPLLVRFSTACLRIWRGAVKGSVSTSRLVGIVLGLCAAAGAVIGGTTGLAFYGLGVVFPVVLLQDSWRYAFFRWGRGYHALINDTIWLIVQVPLMIFLKRTGHANVFWFVLAWGAGALVGCIIGSFQAKVVPDLRTTKQWLVRHRDLGLRFLVEKPAVRSSLRCKATVSRTFVSLQLAPSGLRACLWVRSTSCSMASECSRCRRLPVSCADRPGDFLSTA